MWRFNPPIGELYYNVKVMLFIMNDCATRSYSQNKEVHLQCKKMYLPSR